MGLEGVNTKACQPFSYLSIFIIWGEGIATKNHWRKITPTERGRWCLRSFLKKMSHDLCQKLGMTIADSKKTFASWCIVSCSKTTAGICCFVYCKYPSKYQITLLYLLLQAKSLCLCCVSQGL